MNIELFSFWRSIASLLLCALVVTYCPAVSAQAVPPDETSGPVDRRDNPANKSGGKKYALLVGVQNYNPEFFHRLAFAQSDAVDLAKALTKLGFTPILMTHDADNPLRVPTSPVEITRHLRIVLRGVDKSDTVVIGLFGHGIQFKDDPLLPDGSKEAYFCPATADLNDKRTLLPLSEVYKQLEACPADRKLLLVDACRNEVLSKTARAKEIELDPAGRIPRTVPKGLLALFSCSSGEKSYEDPELKHGAFCYHVLKYVNGEAEARFYPQQQVSLDNLVYFARRETKSFVLKKFSKDQIPEQVGRTSDWPLGDWQVSAPALLLAPFDGATARAAQAAWAAHLKSNIVVQNSIGMKFAIIPPGEFMMGGDESKSDLKAAGIHLLVDDLIADESPRHRVRISRPYFVGMYEVTNGQFTAFVKATGYKTSAERDGKGGWGYSASKKGEVVNSIFNWRRTGFSQTNDHPVVNVSWHDSKAFCNWLSKKEGVVYRLPTEAEWEYSCRAGTTTRYATGNGSVSLDGYANTWDQSVKGKYQVDYKKFRRAGFDDGWIRTSPVGQFKSNAFGLYDMHGNVFEWCQDGYDGKAYQRGEPVTVNPLVTSGSRRVNRGGSWGMTVGHARSAFRNASVPSARFSFMGFRVAMSPPEK